MAQWDKISSRGNVQDRRGMRMAGGIGGLGIGGVALLLVLNYLAGGNPLDVLTQVQPQLTPVETNTEEFAGEDEYEVFAATVLGSTNDLWRGVFEQDNKSYTEPTLVLFRDATRSACGTATSDVGPHYCPADETIYLDETFFEELTSRFGARGGDVAEAYVIAHEAGHHAQYKLGVMEEANSRMQGNPGSENDVSIQLELQADCFAGMWAHSIRDRGIFEAGEIMEAMDAAASVGDDRIQESVGGRINPETWTHGSSADRKAWFSRGYESGTLESCNTFQ